MAITMHYRGVRFVKDYITKFLRSVFLAYEKEAILFTDGTKKIVFSNTPYVTSEDSWVSRPELPAVLIGSMNATFQERTITKNLLVSPGEVVAGYNFEGGDIDISASLMCLSRTTHERDNLSDIVSIFLSRPEAKDYFLDQDIKIVSPPAMSGEGKVFEPAVDYPVYTSNLSWELAASWEQWNDTEDTLANIIVDISASLDLDES